MRHRSGLAVCVLALVFSALGMLVGVPTQGRVNAETEVFLTSEGAVPRAGSEPGASPEVPSDITDSGPVTNVWYGPHQVFGSLGVPQRWVNILGNVSDADGIGSLVYSLNSGSARSLSIGPDGRRLARAGDFNVDIDVEELDVGSNTVVLTATDTLNNQTVETVTVEYVGGNVWPNPYAIDWSSVGSLQDVVQVVDGLWAAETAGLRTVEIGYDRLVAIGDRVWGDYEVTVPVTVHRVASQEAGVGILLGWTGHTDNPVSGWQPKSGWIPFGAICWFRWYPSEWGNRLEIYGNEGRVLGSDISGWLLESGVDYVFKVRVVTNPGEGSLYSFKVWEAGQPEPSGWTVAGQGRPEDPRDGSLLLLAHRVDATFGDVTVTPLQQTYTLIVETVGQGEVNKEPDSDDDTYANGQSVTLTAVPQPDWRFDHWSGDVTGSANPATVSMTRHRLVTAVFVPDQVMLTVHAIGQGRVSHTPGNPYEHGAVAILEPIPDVGWSFGGWSGADAADLMDRGDGTWSLVMRGDKELMATFTQNEYTLTIDTFPESEGGKVSHRPGNPYFHGDEAILEPAADPGWVFDEWQGDASDELTDNGDGTWSLTIDGDKELTARFREARYNATVTIEGKGSVSNSPGNPYRYRAVAMLKPVPRRSWRFAGWAGPDAKDLYDNLDGTWSLRMTGDKEVTALFVTYRSYVPLVAIER
jgi:hypothetical protein